MPVLYLTSSEMNILMTIHKCHLLIPKLACLIIGFNFHPNYHQSKEGLKYPDNEEEGE